MGTLDTVSGYLTVGSSIFQAASIANGLIQGFANGEIDSPEDFFNVLFGGGTDAANQEINQKLDQLLVAVDEISSQIDVLGAELKQMIEEQTDLLVGVEMAQLLSDVSRERERLASFDPYAEPGETGYVAPDQLDGYFQGYVDESSRLLGRISAIANEVLDIPGTEANEKLELNASMVLAINHALELRFQVAARFEQETLGSTQLTSVLQDAIAPLEKAVNNIRGIGPSVYDHEVYSESVNSEDLDGPVYMDMNGDNVADEVHFSYTYYGVRPDANSLSPIQFSTYRDPEIALAENLQIPIFAPPIHIDQNYTLVQDLGNGTYNAVIVDHIAKYESSIPGIDGIENPLEPGDPNLSLRWPDDIDDILNALQSIGYYETVNRLGVELWREPFEVQSAFGGILEVLRDMTGGIESDTPDDLGHIIGSQSRDYLRGDPDGNLISGLSDNDTVRGRDGDDTLFGGPGDDLVKGDSGNDEIYGGVGANYLLGGSGDDTIEAEEVSRMEGGFGNDILDAKGVGFSAFGHDLRGDEGNDTLRGSSKGDVLIGGADDDLLLGRDGDDLMSPGTGNDYVIGGVGFDTVVYDGPIADFVISDVQFGFDPDLTTPFTGFGAQVTGPMTSDLLHTDIEKLVFSDDEIVFGVRQLSGERAPTEGMDILFAPPSNDVIDMLGGNDAIHGWRGDDTIRGGTGNDTMIGGEGLDELFGQSGDDDLDGGEGADTMTGAEGSDTYHVDDIGDLVVEVEGHAGRDHVRSAVDFRIGSSHIEDVSLIGSARIAVGNALGNQLVGHYLDNILDGMGGDDTMMGGTGNDTYVRRDAGDRIIEYENQGHDLVRALMNTGLMDFVEDLELLGADDLNGTGNELNNVLTGNSGNNRLNGKAGNDTIYGGDGEDEMIGGAGIDVMNGGKGGDVYRIDHADDRIIESRSWTGTDTAISSVDFRTGNRHIENVELVGSAKVGAGNGLQNHIKGNAEDNILDGGKNNDTLEGGTGDDRYLVRAPGDTVIEAADEGIDTVLAFRSYAMEAHVEKLFMQTVYTKDGDPAIFNGIGNALDNTIVGTPFDNFVIGREGRDTLKGQGGADSFVFDRAIGASNVDRIIDFNTNSANEGDRLLMKSSEFGGMTTGSLGASAFVTGTVAADASDRFIFDQAAGQLWFDADGSGGAEKVLVATFEQNATVSASDIEIF
ncbi:calcium-binding protein [Pseudooceanicola atlanticus]|uniref:Haemolysin-type calcium binding-related domain-containing protein n=1 Tax=Pseudooceanicola atlanticus TaxID=1461694 RepID=A0A0A0EHZ7_9RHOB|nr:calcium-binding protein [Pseudooceanicola atlanticus]KGM50591.1 hypothetical protein ATO9_03665 [Pseudooceanicola atlanticus]